MGVDPYIGQNSLGVLLVDFSTLTGYGVTAGATMELVSSSVPEIGKTGNSIKVTVPAGTTKSFDLASFSALNVANQSFMLVFDNQTLGLNATSVWYMGVQSALTDQYYTTFSYTQYGLCAVCAANNGTINKWSTGSGSPSFSTLTDGRINITANAANDAVIVFHGIYAAPRQMPIIQLIQNDGSASGYTEFLPLLNKYGMKAGFAIIKDLVGTGGYLTEAQLGYLSEQGHDLLPYGQNALSSLASAGAAIADIKSNTDYLDQFRFGKANICYVYPAGVQYYSATDRTSITDYLASAGVDAAYLASGYTHQQAGSIGNLNIPRYAVNAAVNTTTLLNYVDLAIDSCQGMCLMLHAIVASSATGNSSNRADIDTVLSGIRDRVRAGKCVVLPPTVAAKAHKSGWSLIRGRP